jgi:hypothetical protein
MLCEVVGSDEGEDMRLEAVEVGVVEDLERGMLFGSSARPTVGPGLIGFGQLVGNAVLGTGAAEDVTAGKSDVRPCPILR